MLTLLKLVQSIIKTLHSQGTPGQVAAGVALGSAIGLTPLLNLHNLFVGALILILNVSFGGGMSLVPYTNFTIVVLGSAVGWLVLFVHHPACPVRCGALWRQRR